MPYIKTVKAKGRTYEYFDTGQKTVRGKPILKPLPARSDKTFGGVYAGLLAGRTARKNLAPSVTMRELSREYQRSPRFTRRADGTQTTYLTYLAHIEKMLGMARVDRVERKDIVKLLTDMQDRPSAANMVLMLLKLMFGIAINREWVKINPTAEIAMLEEEDEDYEPWPDDLLAAGLADPGMGFAISLIYFTGQRIGDTCKMRWADIQDDGTIYVQQEKTGRERWIPMHKDLRALLDSRPRDTDTILPGRKGKPMRTQTLRGQIQRWALDRGASIVPHGLRKNAVNALLEAGCGVAEVSSITGQSLAMVEHYAKRRNTRKIAHKAMSKWSGTDGENSNGLENQ
jgi:integrase